MARNIQFVWVAVLKISMFHGCLGEHIGYVDL